MPGASATAATPQSAPVSNPQPDAASVAAAGRLLDAMGYDTMISQMVEKMSAQFGPQMKQSLESKTGKPVSPEMISEMVAAQRRFVEKFTSGPKLRQAMEVLYATHFTAVELGRMAVLMRDPVMQRWNQKIPEVMTDMLPLVTQQMDAHGDELRREITAIIVTYMDKPGAGSDVN